MTELQPLPFALPDVGEAEVEAMVSAVRSGWLSTGPQAKAFEEDFAGYCGDGVTALTVNSATAGLHLALEAIGVGPGDEVIVPTWTFTATAEVVRYLGAEPVFVDVDPVTLNIDLSSADSAVTERTRAIMPVHFAGLPVSPSAVRSIADRHGLKVVEDAAHALPASSEGELVGGGQSDATVFSFYATKTITTGEGGMVVTRSHEISDRIKVMRLHGISRDAFDRYRSTVPSWQYDVVAPGYKYNLTDPAAAMGRVQLGRARQMRDRRAEIAARYHAAFEGLDLQLPDRGSADTLHAWHLYVVRVPPGDDRDQFIRELADRGIGTSVHFIPLHLHPYWRDRAGLTPDQFPRASAEFGRVVSLPIFSSMNEAQIERVVGAVTSLRGA